MMGLWRRWRGRRQREQEFADELAAHLEHSRARLEAEGLSPAEAAREARRRLGNATRHRERLREVWTFPALEALGRDLRFGLRLLARDRVFSGVAFLTLTLGIGANAALFTLLDGLLLRSLPIERPGELMRLAARNLPKGSMQFTNGVARTPTERQQLPFALYAALAESPSPFSGVFGQAGASTVTLDGRGGPREVRIAQVTGSFFDVLELHPQAGRLFGPSDDVPGGPPGAWPLVLSDGAWTRLYGRDPRVIGMPVTIERVPFTILGVAPPGFRGIHAGSDTEVWAPLSAMEPMYPLFAWRRNPGLWMLQVYGRRRPARDAAAAAAEVAAMSGSLLAAAIEPGLSETQRRDHLAIRLTAHPAGDGASAVAEQYGRALWILQAAVGAVLLIAATNLTNLLLARSAARAPELNVRLALGASAARIRRQLLLENAVVLAAGAAGGVALAAALLALWKASPEAPWHAETALDWRVLAFLAAVLGGVGLVAGWLPAWSVARGGTGRTTAGRRAMRLRAGLIVLQTALSFALLGFAGLMGRSLATLLREPTGFGSTSTVLLSPDLFNAGVSRERMPEVYRTLLGEAREAPGVTAAAWTRQVPLSGGMSARSIEVPGREGMRGRERMIFVHEVSDGYFAALGIPLAAGEDLPPQQAARPGAVCVLSENAARTYFGSVAAALGRRVRFDGEPGWMEVRGVARDTKYMHIREPEPLTIYVPYWRGPGLAGPGMTLAVRHRGEAAGVTRHLQTLFTAAAGRPPLVPVRTVEENRRASVRTERWLAGLLGALAAFALLMSVTGIAGLLAYDVVQRRKEIGIRLALGAAPGSIGRRVAGGALALAAAGIAAGGALSGMGLRAIDSYLFHLEPLAPPVWVAAGAVLLASAAAAAALPAWRASRIDPSEMLRRD